MEEHTPENIYEKHDKEIEMLNGVLERLEKRIENQNSFWLNFVRGIFNGVGFLIGTTIIAGIVIGILFWFLGFVPFFENPLSHNAFEGQFEGIGTLAQ